MSIVISVPKQRNHTAALQLQYDELVEPTTYLPTQAPPVTNPRYAAVSVFCRIRFRHKLVIL
jgi:hypothetical protein